MRPSSLKVIGFALRKASRDTPVFWLKCLMLFVSWFRLQQPLRRFRTWETLMTKAVRGTFMSSTAYSGGSASPSDSSEDEVSGSRASSGSLRVFGGFAGFTGGSGWLPSSPGPCCLGARGAPAAAPPLPGSPSNFLPWPPWPSSLRRPSVWSPALLPPGSPTTSASWPCPAVVAPCARSRERGPLPLAAGGCSSTAGGGAQSFFSFQPDFAKSSEIGRSGGGVRGAKAGV
mmetsp:Transcript_62923/g.177468  ORF Transcript_62923/g.177468 Transcript_62923/m.177468 type:complete len:230 (-) Transcript_62923:39-728(-)